MSIENFHQALIANERDEHFQAFARLREEVAAVQDQPILVWIPWGD